MINEISKTISHAIEEQFPGVYREDADIMVAFIRAYYEFLETQEGYSTNVSRKMFESNDIDESLDKFLTHFKEKYLADLPYDTLTDQRFLNKHIMELYRTKGSEQSVQLFMKLVYGESAKVYYPGRDILKPSESVWRRWPYIEVYKNDRTQDMVNREITGATSGAKAFVETANTKRVNGKIIDILYLSSVRGNFTPGERITENGVLKDAPIISGSLTDISITLGGRNNKIGDVFDAVGADGVQGKVRVSSVEDATGRVEFNLVNGGWGYSNSQSEFDTSVYVATAMLGNDNSDPRYQFLDFETVTQRKEKLTLLSSSDLNTDVSVGDTLIGVDALSAEVARGKVISIANTDANGDVIGLPSANSEVVINVLYGTTFDDTKTLTLDTTGHANGEILEEESVVTFNISANTGPFSPGDDIVQYIYGSANTIVTKNEAKVVTANASVITTNAAFGDWVSNVAIQSVANSLITATISTLSVDTIGAKGKIVSVDGANVTVSGIFGAYDAGNDVRGLSTLITANINSIANTGAVDIHLEGNTSSNGVIDTITNVDASGIVIAQNTTYVGLWGNTEPFFFHPDHEFYVVTERNTQVSPPKFEWYDVTKDLDASKIIGVEDTFSIETLATDLGVANTVIANNDLVASFNTTFPTPLQSGVAFEVGNATNGTILAMAPSSANTSKVSLYAFSGVVADANSHAIVEVPSHQLPDDGSDHEVRLYVDMSAGELSVHIDGFNMGTSNTADGSGFTSYWANTAALGAFTTVASDHAGSAIGYSEVTHGDWKGTISSDLGLYVGSTANTAATPGNIIHLERPLTDIGEGFGADFKVGIIEDTENVLVNTDLLGGNNAAGIPYMNIKLNGENSGVGFVDSITVVDGGTQYTNGSLITFSGGGFANGDVIVDAVGTIATDANGTITTVTVTEPGVGYHEAPTPTLPVTAGLDANVTINMDFGYGFPILPDGDENTPIADLLTSATIEIGSIATLTRINPGTDYNLDPFVRARQNDIAAYDRRDFYALVSNTSGGFIPGEELIQNIGGSETAKGTVKSFEVVNGYDILLVERNSFSVSFQSNYAITGSISGATTWVDEVYSDEESRPIGDNSDITGTVIAANGIVTGVEVISSGYGYIDGTEVSLEREGFPFVMSGETAITRQGISEGHWETTDSHLSSEKKIQDSYYYQEYSYDVVSGISLSKYKDAIKQILHVSGNEIFGSISKVSTTNSGVSVANSSIEIA